MSVLRLEHVSVRYGAVSAVSDVSASVAEGEIFALVGESGCGKTTLAMAIMGLLPASASIEGMVEFLGRDLTALDEDERAALRGDRISMVFQDPASALDPAFSVGEQIAETIRAHRRIGSREAKRRALRLLEEVGIPDASRRYRDPPHRFSGGMQQRVVIATALANEPALLIADEPTAALDVTIQAQILSLMRELRRRHRTTILLIAHDFGVVAQLCDRAGVLYAGQLVEVAPVADLFAGPRHPYTATLLAALPSAAQERGALAAAPGQVPDLVSPPPGCRFQPRCPLRRPECDLVPPLAALGEHLTACWATPETQEAGREAVALAGGGT
jgi:oligopeptide/dipeptide ABC transporter ATP-binding protein